MDPLSTLNLAPGSTLSDAKKQYRLLSLKYHPDKNPDNSSAEEMFYKITDSYEIIKSNPQILISQKDTYKPRGYFGYLIVEAKAVIADVYLNKVQSIQVVRKRFCVACEGSGSSLGVKGICGLCNGRKKVKNKVSSLIGIKDACPACKGTGRKEAPKCSSCSGSGFQEERIAVPYTINQRQFRSGLVVVRNVGNEYKKGFLGDIHIKLKIDDRSPIRLEEETYRFSYKISPAQYALGDKVKIKLFGKSLNLNIPKEETDTSIRDKRDDGITRNIHIDLMLTSTVLTPEIKKLYKEIIKLEKS